MSLVEEEHSSVLSSSLPSKSSKSSSFFWQSSPAESPDSSSCYRKIDIRHDKYLDRYLADLEGQKEAVKAAWKAQAPDTTSQGNRLDSFLSLMEVFLSNMPLTIGAVGLSWVTMGVVWWKFMEENNDFCTPVHFFSPQCSYPEFPGCFHCDTTQLVYRIALYWHYSCHIVGGLCCAAFLCKVLIAWRVVADELRNPATSTPMGVVCITMVCVFAGRGWLGEIIVVATSCFHLLLSFWFLHTAINVYQLWPDPGWFPNTVGIAYAAIKTWLYFPWTGKFLMTLCMAFFFGTYFISLYRVAHNTKITLPVCFIQLSAPSITMYAMTIMSQPNQHREDLLEDDSALMHHYSRIHHDLYLPAMHGMFALSLIGMVSILHALYHRWSGFIAKEFSPAHAALVFPILSHTNSIQAYRSGVDSFSSMAEGSPFKVVLFTYWFACLIVGTIINLTFTYHYMIRLPRWTNLVQDLDEDSVVSEVPQDISFHQTVLGHLQEAEMHESFSNDVFLSSAVLQANEEGALVRNRRGTEDYATYGHYKRTRKVSALGFDPILSELEFETERAKLLEWAAANTPRRRQRTLSNSAALLSSINKGLPHGLYGSIGESSEDEGNKNSGRTHSRSRTML